MDLSIFLILIFVAFQFIAEYLNWNQTKVKLAIFIATLIITLPNFIFMVIDWWESPHSKLALLVLNTVKPILRGETYRLFRWLKSIGINLACDDVNHLPITKLGLEATEFYLTRECLDQAEATSSFGMLWNIVDEVIVAKSSDAYVCGTKSSFFWAKYKDGVFQVHQLKNSRKLMDLVYGSAEENAYIGHPLFRSSLMKSASYAVDSSRAQLLFTRLLKICFTEMPILAEFEHKREWLYFHAVPTLDNLNADLVLVQSQGECIAVGSPRNNIINQLGAILNRRRNAASCDAAETR